MSALPANPHYSIQKILIAVACGVLASCSSGTMSSSSVNPVNWITPYKVDVIQGNFVSREQVEQLQAGMTRDQVKAVLGTPLLTSLFHADRWDYVFTLKRQGVEPQAFKYTVFFKGDQLERFSGDSMPSEAEFISTLSNKRVLGKVPVLQASEEQLKAAEKSSVSKTSPGARSDAANVPVGPSTTVYPPLESPRQ
ncbi:outer membrane protein assembly factor BamE [Rhodoferax sp.]|uniref:outer membrane protein assembly factor BamE n=1 Tax=Rhodoferax sp. TaxID=50421 RepID=UPI0026230CC0|nr:outer membrane protein assembly factor BamE [Rhodoferax sp.]MDD3938122.1 outer membrane protein assembly factor BamE [Rhodoferax sp.]